MERRLVRRLGRVGLRARRGEGEDRPQLRQRRRVLDELQGLAPLLRPVRGPRAANEVSMK